MKILSCTIEVYSFNNPDDLTYNEVIKSGYRDDKYAISEIECFNQDIKLTNEQYSFLFDAYSKRGEKPNFRDVREDFMQIYLKIAEPLLKDVDKKYHQYGFSEEYIENKMRSIGVSISPYFKNDDTDEVAETIEEDGLVYEILKDGNKRLVECLDEDIENLVTDATIIKSIAFNNCKKLREVRLPNVTYIGNSAFSRCTYLHTVELSPDLKTIDDFAFADCYFLHKINLPEGLEVIGESAFNSCVNLDADIKLPSTVKYIDYNAFVRTPLSRFSKNPEWVCTYDSE